MGDRFWREADGATAGTGAVRGLRSPGSSFPRLEDGMSSALRNLVMASRDGIIPREARC